MNGPFQAMSNKDFHAGNHMLGCDLPATLLHLHGLLLPPSLCPTRDCVKKTFESKAGLETVSKLALANARDLVPLIR